VNHANRSGGLLNWEVPLCAPVIVLAGWFVSVLAWLLLVLVSAGVAQRGFGRPRWIAVVQHLLQMVSVGLSLVVAAVILLIMLASLWEVLRDRSPDGRRGIGETNFGDRLAPPPDAKETSKDITSK
jgi:hypothetical protein